MSKISERKQKDIEKQLERIKQERDENETNRRFGFFSIPYPATVGDETYSQETGFKNHKVVDRKIIIEKRNIFVKPLIKGKANDIYFQPVEPFSDDQLKHFQEMTEQERKDLMALVQTRKEKKATTNFKPGGPQEVFGYYHPGDMGDRPAPTGTVYIEPDKKRFIMEGGKVKTENRGVFTNPTKLGTALNPNDYFSYYGAIPELQDRIKTLGEKDIEDKLKTVQIRKEKKAGKEPFHPAALKKCEPFYNNIETYGIYNEEEKKQRLDEYREYKKVGNPKYIKTLPNGCVKHMQPFKLARLTFTGRDGLFNDDLYKLPELTEKDIPKVIPVRERKEKEAEEKKNKRNPFTYNKLQKNTSFAPPITSYLTNLKKEFPSIKFH